MRFRVWIMSAAACGAFAASAAVAQIPQPTPQQEAVQFQPAAPPAGVMQPGGTAVQPPAPNFNAPPLPASSGGTAPVSLVPLPPPSVPTLQAVPAAGTPTAAMPSASSTAAVPVAAGQASLTVKQVLPETVIPGQPVVADVTVTNAGTKTADNVVLTGWWTTGYELTEASVVAQTVNGRRAWGLGAIAAGETRTLKVKLAPQPGVAITEFRSGFDATFSSASDTRSVKVLKPEVQLQLVAPEVAFVGQPVVVQLRVKNPTAMPLSAVTIRSTLPDTLAHPKGSNLESELGVLPAGATEVIPLDLTAAKAGDGRVRIRVAAPGCEAVEQEVRLVAMEARVGVTLNGPKGLYTNWPATYEAVIENQGDQPVRGAAFEVKLPAGFTDLRASDKPGYDAGSHRIVWKMDDLKPGEKRTVIWFGFGKQADDLVHTGTVTVSGAPLKRAEWVTKNMGVEAK